MPRKHDDLPHRPSQAPRHTWAEPGSATVTLPAASGKTVAVRAGALPVSLAVPARKSTVSASTAAGTAAPLAGAAKVQVLDQKTAQAAGVDGLLFTVTPQQGSDGSAVGVRVDDSGYAQ
ncbi:hypothetical protein, partial [Peterkaempfera griseoplana]|uniref:hypothetical protein n=1 Tax=Peterkaempfera griseoplana TaxID=66896 RepID=UPI0012FF4872